LQLATLDVSLSAFCNCNPIYILIITKMLPSMCRKEGNQKSTAQSQRQTLAQLEHQQFPLSQALGGAAQSQAAAPDIHGDHRWIAAAVRSSAGPPSTGYPMYSSAVAPQQQVAYAGSFLPSGEHLPRASHGLPFQQLQGFPFQHQNQTFAGLSGVANSIPQLLRMYKDGTR
jgi:hypothetical protein